MKERFVILLACALFIWGCATKKGAAPSVERAFPAAEIPMMIEEPDARVSWLVKHFWDRFTEPDSLYFSDSLHVNGVPADDLEKQMGIFSTLLEQSAVPDDGAQAMSRLFERSEAFQKVHPSANLFPQMTELVSKYFYDPNSPLRNEELYLPYVQGLAQSALIDPAERARYSWQAEKCALNRPGTPAADFVFVDTAGRRRTLHGIQADLLLLIFGNPDCQACKELQEVMEGNESLSAAIASGQLKVVDIYIDEDIEGWKKHAAEYPSSWINGYDPGLVIRTDLLYNVRALPSLYLLSSDKKVLLKDCTPEQFFASLGL